MKKLGVVLAGVGTFLIVLALLARFYAYDRLAVVPIDQETVSYSAGEDATIFSIVDGEEITTDLLSTVKVAGDIDAAEEASEALDRDVAVWEKTTTTTPPDAEISEENPPLSFSHDYVAFDRHTGEVLEWEGNFLSSSVDPDTGDEIRDFDTEIAGWYFKLPFNAEQKSYPWWDGTLKEAVELEYQETEEIKGVSVYKFMQSIEPTDVGDIDAPASLFGVDEEGDVTLDRMYANVRTLWIEPTTGVIIKSQEEQNVTAEYEGETVATLTDVVSIFDDETISNNVDEYGPKATQLKAVRTWVPIGAGVLGALLLLGGVILIVRGNRNARRGL